MTRIDEGLIRLRVPGHPVAKGRPRMTKQGHAYTPKETVIAQAVIQDVWSRASSPWIEGDLRLVVVCGFARPKSHYLVNGDLSAVGMRTPYPAKAPDGDNILKTVTDALNTCAYKDDSQIIDWRLHKRWIRRSESEFTLIVISKMGEANARTADASLGEGIDGNSREGGSAELLQR